jgi:NADH-quinone oxidoreductase E subunit
VTSHEGAGHLAPEIVDQARQLLSLYPHPRSALVPICHLAQEQDGWLRPEAVEEIASLVGITPAEVIGTATFYEMLRTKPVGRYVVSVCTNIACMLRGAYELLAHAEHRLGVRTGATTADAMFTLEEAECIADCGRAPCLQVNHRFFGNLTSGSFDRLLDDLRRGDLDDEVPHHGTLVRVRRQGGLRVDDATVRTERAAANLAMTERASASRGGDTSASGTGSGAAPGGAS